MGLGAAWPSAAAASRVRMEKRMLVHTVQLSTSVETQLQLLSVLMPGPGPFMSRADPPLACMLHAAPGIQMSTKGFSAKCETNRGFWEKQRSNLQKTMCGPAPSSRADRRIGDPRVPADLDVKLGPPGFGNEFW